DGGGRRGGESGHLGLTGVRRLGLRAGGEGAGQDRGDEQHDDGHGDLDEDRQAQGAPVQVLGGVEGVGGVGGVGGVAGVGGWFRGVRGLRLVVGVRGGGGGGIPALRVAVRRGPGRAGGVRPARGRRRGQGRA